MKHETRNRPPFHGATDLPLDRPALHSFRVRIIHPITGKLVEVEAPPPPDMADLL